MPLILEGSGQIGNFDNFFCMHAYSTKMQTRKKGQLKAERTL